MFSGKTCCDGPAFDQEVTAPGKWYIYYGDPYKTGGDYVAVLGFEEAFSFLDIMRALIRTPTIWFNGHLPTKCRSSSVTQLKVRMINIENGTILPLP